MPIQKLNSIQTYTDKNPLLVEVDIPESSLFVTPDYHIEAPSIHFDPETENSYRLVGTPNSPLTFSELMGIGLDPRAAYMAGALFIYDPNTKKVHAYVQPQVQRFNMKVREFGTTIEDGGSPISTSQIQGYNNQIERPSNFTTAPPPSFADNGKPAEGLADATIGKMIETHTTPAAAPTGQIKAGGAQVPGTPAVPNNPAINSGRTAPLPDLSSINLK